MVSQTAALRTVKSSFLSWFQEKFLGNDRDVTTLVNRNTMVGGNFDSFVDLVVPPDVERTPGLLSFAQGMYDYAQAQKRSVGLGLNRSAFERILQYGRTMEIGTESIGVQGPPAIAIVSAVEQLETQQELTVTPVRERRYTMADKCDLIIQVLGGEATPSQIRDHAAISSRNFRRSLDWIRTVLRRNSDRFIETEKHKFIKNPNYHAPLPTRIKSIIRVNGGKATYSMIREQLASSNGGQAPHERSVLNVLHTQEFKRTARGAYEIRNPHNDKPVSITLADHCADIIREEGPMRIKDLVKRLLEKGIKLSSKNAYTLVKTAIKRNETRFVRTERRGEYDLRKSA